MMLRRPTAVESTRPPPAEAGPSDRHAVLRGPWPRLADEWRSWSVLPAAPNEPAALVLGSVLNPAAALNKPASASRFGNTTVLKYVDDFLVASWTRKLLLNKQLVVRLIHDAVDLPWHFTHRGVEVHRVAPSPLPAHDARWDAQLRVLRAHPPAADACVFAVDFYDVRLVGDLPALCAHHAADTLYVASDMCHHSQPAKALMAMQANVTGFSPSPYRHGASSPGFPMRSWALASPCAVGPWLPHAQLGPGYPMRS
jgi:hypothetical protein